MYIHHVIASINEEIGGPAVSTTRLNHNLNSLGLHSTIHAIDYPHHGPLADPDAGPFPRASFLTRSLRGWSPAFRSHLNDSLEQRPGIIHNHGCWMMPNRDARHLARMHQCPLITSPRGMLEPWAMKFNQIKKNLAWGLYERANLNAATAFHATSMAEVHSIRSLGFKQPVYLIPNGVDIPHDDHLSMERPFSNPYVLFLSRIHPKKGIDMLINTWEQLHRNFPDWKLVIAGTDLNHYSSSLKHKIKQAGMQDSIIWNGPTRGDAKSQLLRHASLLALPTYSENFGLVVAEALAHKTPVLTTDQTPWGELTQRHCGWVISPEPGLLNTALKKALETSSQELIEMGLRGRRWMQSHFGWNQIAKNMQSAYLHLSGNQTEPECLVKI